VLSSLFSFHDPAKFLVRSTLGAACACPLVAVLVVAGGGADVCVIGPAGAWAWTETAPAQTPAIAKTQTPLVIGSIKVEVKKKHISLGWNFSCFAAHLIERDLF
jgi:hypothetical protein